MPDPHCPHLAPVGGWCRLATNFKCPAKPGRVGCPTPNVGSLEQRSSERHATKEATMTEQHRVFAELAKPFPAQEIQWKVQSVSRDRRRALVLAYLDARAIMDRLDAIVGPAGWTDSYEVYPVAETGNQQLARAKCSLTILGITKEDVGESSMTTDQASSVKAAVSDALKRAAVKFGVGRYLYRLDSTWVDYDDTKKAPLETPALPAWALPTEEPRAVPLPDRLPVLPNRAPVASPATSNNAEARANISKMPAPQGDTMLAEMIRTVRELPGGEATLRRLVNGDWSRRSVEEKRRLYADLRRAHRELSSKPLKSA